jgi:hypothetical protein
MVNVSDDGDISDFLHTELINRRQKYNDKPLGQ